MSAELKIYFDDNSELNDLQEWMSGHAGVFVAAVPRAGEPNAQGTVWDFLSVVCASAGPVSAAVRALQLWIESRVTVVRIVVGDKSVTVTTSAAATVLPQVEKAASKMLESGEARSQDA